MKRILASLMAVAVPEIYLITLRPQPPRLSLFLIKSRAEALSP